VSRGILVHGDNHFIVHGPRPSPDIALALARHWSVIKIGATTPPELRDWRIVSKEFRENLEWAVIVPGTGETSPAVAQLLNELSGRGIAIETCVHQALRDELLAMRAEDLRVREELLIAGELGPAYSPRMEAVHRKNAARLREIIAEHGWPDADLVGPEGTAAAYIIAQHSIGEPEFQRAVLALVKDKVHQAFLSDRIAMYEGRPQRYGTQALPSPDGKHQRWTIEDPEHVNERRAAIGMDPITLEPMGEITAETQAAYDAWLRDYEAWLVRVGWR
jgi:hypothetical protein